MPRVTRSFKCVRARGTLPYRAKIMASSRLVLPAPVGPVIVKSSSSLKSTHWSSRKAVKPSTSSRRGRISRLLVEVVEELSQLLRGLRAVPSLVVALEQLRRSQSPELGDAALWILVLVYEANLDRVREDFTNSIDESRHGTIAFEKDTEVGLLVDVDGIELIERGL